MEQLVLVAQQAHHAVHGRDDDARDGPLVGRGNGIGHGLRPAAATRPLKRHESVRPLV